MVSNKALNRVGNFLGGLEVYGDGRVVYANIGGTGHPVAVERIDGTLVLDIQACNVVVAACVERGA